VIEQLDSLPKKMKTLSRRTLHEDSQSPGSRTVVVAEADIHVSGQPSLEHLITKLSADMHMLFSSSERMDKLESGLEKRIANKVSQLLDKIMNSEMIRIRKDVDERIEAATEALRVNVAEDIQNVSAKITSLASNTGLGSNTPEDITKNFVIRGLPETHKENIVNKVNALFKGGLKVPDVTCSNSGAQGVVKRFSYRCCYC
jgi:predicted transposase YbfD/YdcC